MSKMIPRVPPTPDLLRKLSQHVAYEVKMLLGTATKLLGERTTDWFDVRAQAESFLFHARALYQFFYWDPPKQIRGDQAPPLFAVDYLPTWKPLDDRGEVLHSLSRDVGRRVVHITAERVVGQDYLILDAARALLEVIRAFHATAPRDFTADFGPLDPPWDAAKGIVYGSKGVTHTSADPEGSTFVPADGTPTR